MRGSFLRLDDGFLVGGFIWFNGGFNSQSLSSHLLRVTSQNEVRIYSDDSSLFVNLARTSTE